MWGAALSAVSGGGGGIGGGQSSSASSDSTNNISTGSITVGGLNMGPPPSDFDAEMVLKGGAVVGIAVAAFLALKKFSK
jgi:hypothetical protein